MPCAVDQAVCWQPQAVCSDTNQAARLDFKARWEHKPLFFITTEELVVDLEEPCPWKARQTFASADTGNSL